MCHYLLLNSVNDAFEARAARLLRGIPFAFEDGLEFESETDDAGYRNTRLCLEGDRRA